MNKLKKSFIACGMYSFSDDLIMAWQRLFTSFFELHDTGGEREIELRFDSEQSLLRDPGLFFGHTCGYPLMKHLKNWVTPFCVPVFDLPGTDGKLYSSRFIVAAKSAIESLDECRQKVVAINAGDSNSGMNVLRYAIAESKPPGRFFSRTIETGSHLASLEAVASGTADLAAIDCVSYQLIQDHSPALVDQVRSLGFSVKTCGLPFVVPNASSAEVDSIQLLEKLNQALRLAPESVRKQLHLNRFEAVSLKDYQGIVDLESFAIDSGYAHLD